MNSRNNTYRIAVIGLMSAVAFISNYFSIPIGEVSRVHLGNGFCVLSGLLLGPVAGGLSAGFGAFFFDLTNPLYAKEAFITFMMKFVIGFIAGSLFSIVRHQKSKLRLVLSAVVASFSYIPIYLLKGFISDHFFLRLSSETIALKMLTKLTASTTNAVCAVVVAVILFPVFLGAMKRSGIYQKLYH